MFYAPHDLYKIEEFVQRDAYGSILGVETREVFVCKCRCDDSGEVEMKTDNGRAFIPKYHIVCPRVGIKAGDNVVAYHDGKIRGKGEVKKTARTNFYDYEELWV